MANAISTWLDDFKRLHVELMDDECLRVGSQIGKKLLGVEDENIVEDDDIVTTLTQAKEDEEEYSPEWIAKMEKMMVAYDKKKTGAEGSSVGCENNSGETMHDAPVVGQHMDDQPGYNDLPGDPPMHEAGADDIPNIISNKDGGAGFGDTSKRNSSEDAIGPPSDIAAAAAAVVEELTKFAMFKHLFFTCNFERHYA